VIEREGERERERGRASATLTSTQTQTQTQTHIHTHTTNLHATLHEPNNHCLVPHIYPIYSKRMCVIGYEWVWLGMCFCRIWSLLQGFFAKETYNFKEPTNLCFVPHIYRYPTTPTRIQTKRNYRSLLQNIVSFIGHFCKTDL